jgi:Protein of unknown function (DUF2934)
MPERCKSCEEHEKRLKVLREGRTSLWRRGELTEAADKKIAADEQRVIDGLEKHRIAQHDGFRAAKATSAVEAHPNLEEEIRRHAYELYEERGREDGHDLDDWLQAEAEITTKNSKNAAA